MVCGVHTFVHILTYDPPRTWRPSSPWDNATISSSPRLSPPPTPSNPLPPYENGNTTIRQLYRVGKLLHKNHTAEHNGLEIYIRCRTLLFRGCFFIFPTILSSTTPRMRSIIRNWRIHQRLVYSPENCLTNYAKFTGLRTREGFEKIPRSKVPAKVTSRSRNF